MRVEQVRAPVLFPQRLEAGVPLRFPLAVLDNPLSPQEAPRWISNAGLPVRLPQQRQAGRRCRERRLAAGKVAGEPAFDRIRYSLSLDQRQLAVGPGLVRLVQPPAA